MEKKKCHYPLSSIKKLILEGKCYVTKNAQRTALHHFEYSEEDIFNEIINLKLDDFYKSMTSHNDHYLWHDVYKKKINSFHFYIKIQILDGNTLVISFKGDENK